MVRLVVERRDLTVSHDFNAVFVLVAHVFKDAFKDHGVYFCFFSSRRRHTRCYRDWSSDVCSSDLKRVLLLFYEPSTRTRSSFEIAAKSLGAMTTLVLSSGSSVEKGESLLDTVYTLRAVGADVLVIRHPCAGAPLLAARHLDIPVVN